MSIKRTFALSALAAALLLAGCATTPKATAPTGEAAPVENNEPDLVAQLRERMASGTLQRQEKTEDRKPSEAMADTSKSPVVNTDIAKQQAAMAVAGDYARALGLMNADKDDEALALMQKIAEKAPQFSGPLVNQGVILLKQKKFADAQKALEDALKINPRNPYAFNLLGISLREQGKFADAKAAYESALAIDPNYARAHFNLGVLADLYMQDLPLALSHYERYQALQSKPDLAVGNWIVDLQKRTGVYKAPVQTPLPPAPEPAEEAAEPQAAEGSAPAPEAAPAPAPAKADAAPADSTAAPVTNAAEQGKNAS
ncbi:MAG TPA: tetratricopeptide repeat protein [Moraxellaceae bacterium]